MLFLSLIPNSRRKNTKFCTISKLRIILYYLWEDVVALIRTRYIFTIWCASLTLHSPRCLLLITHVGFVAFQLVRDRPLALTIRIGCALIIVWRRRFAKYHYRCYLVATSSYHYFFFTCLQRFMKSGLLVLRQFIANIWQSASHDLRFYFFAEIIRCMSELFSAFFFYYIILCQCFASFKVPMKRKLSLSFLKENLKWQSNIFSSFWFPCFVFEIFEFVWYVNLTYTITLRHTLHNDLSQKILYLCYFQTKTLNIYRLCCRRNTRTWFLIRQVFCSIIAKICNPLRQVIMQSVT